MRGVFVDIVHLVPVLHPRGQYPTEVANPLSAAAFRPIADPFHLAIRANTGFLVIGPEHSWSDRGWSRCAARHETSPGRTDAPTADHHSEQTGFRARLRPAVERG